MTSFLSNVVFAVARRFFPILGPIERYRGGDPMGHGRDTGGQICWVQAVGISRPRRPLAFDSKSPYCLI